MIDEQVKTLPTEISGPEFYRNLIAEVKEEKVDMGFARTLLEYWRERLDNPSDSIRSDFIEYVLFWESICYGLVSATFVDAQERVIGRHFGIFPEERAHEMALQQIDFPELAKEGKVLLGEQDLYYRFFTRTGSGSECSVLVTSVHPPEHEHMVRLKRVLASFVFQHCVERLPHTHNLYAHLKTEIKRVISESSAESVTFAYLRLENLRKYLTLGGDYFGYEILHSTLTQIYANTSREDICYVIQPGQYLIVCPGKSEEELKEKFRKIDIKIKSLLLSYQIHYFSTSIPLDDVDIIWDKLITGK